MRWRSCALRTVSLLSYWNLSPLNTFFPAHHKILHVSSCNFCTSSTEVTIKHILHHPQIIWNCGSYLYLLWGRETVRVPGSCHQQESPKFSTASHSLDFWWNMPHNLSRYIPMTCPALILINSSIQGWCPIHNCLHSLMLLASLQRGNLATSSHREFPFW